jgi:hypothetical protein
MAIMRSRPIVKKLTEEEAVEFQKIPLITYLERDLKDYRTEALKDAIINDQHIPYNWYRAHVGKGKKLYRINGNHSSKLFAEEPSLIKDDMYVIYWDAYCDTDEEAASLYVGIDARVSARTRQDTYKAVVKADPKLRGVHKKVLNPVVTAIYAADIGYKFTKNSTSGVSEIKRASLVRDPVYRDFMLFIDRIASHNAKGVGPILRGPVLAGIFMLYSHGVNLNDLEKFVCFVRDGNHPNIAHPSTRLKSWLGDYTVSRNETSSGEADEKKKCAIPNVFMKWVVESWNRSYNGDMTPIRVHKNSKVNPLRTIATIVGGKKRLKASKVELLLKSV